MFVAYERIVSNHHCSIAHIRTIVVAVNVAANPFGITHPNECKDHWAKINGSSNALLTTSSNIGHFIIHHRRKHRWTSMDIDGCIHPAQSPISLWCSDTQCTRNRRTVRCVVMHWWWCTSLFYIFIILFIACMCGLVIGGQSSYSIAVLIHHQIAHSWRQQRRHAQRLRFWKTVGLLRKNIRWSSKHVLLTRIWIWRRSMRRIKVTAPQYDARDRDHSRVREVN